MQDFTALVRDALQRGVFVSLVLSKPRQGTDAPRKQTVRPVDIQGGRRLQWTSHFDRRETHRNLTVEESCDELGRSLGLLYEHGHLFTTEADYAARVDAAGGARTRRSRPTHAAAGPAGHDRVKEYLIPEGRPCPFLEAVGVMNAAGRVHASHSHKFRQINRFLEFVEDIYPALPAEGPLSVVDFGCGKSYLTFAVHHLLATLHQREVRIVGLDRNESVIAGCRAIGQRLEMPGLTFQTGDIAHHQAERHVHLAVSLHACDTASDDAIAQAVRWGAEVILAVPCCHHELAPQIESPELAALLDHGILRERFAALATDALRAAALEMAGYRTQVIEFIDLEHTAKNLLLRAVRRAGTAPSSQSTEYYQRLKRLLGSPSLQVEKTLLPLVDAALQAAAGV